MLKTKILIVDDCQLIREGLKVLLQLENDHYDFIVDEASSGEEAIEKITTSHYNIILMDYEMPKQNGAETTRAMVTHKPDIKILALSNYNETAFIKEMLKSGAKGYILKNIDYDELLKAITTVLNEGVYFSNEVAVKLIDVKNNSLKMKKTSSENKLSEREHAILRLIAEGHTSETIAKKLFLSKHTIDKYRKNILVKMKVSNVAGLLRQARNINLLN